MINSKDTRSRLKSLLDSFDKDYLEELFDEGTKSGLFPPGLRQNYKYSHKGWTYIISRFTSTPPGSEILKRVDL